MGDRLRAGIPSRYVTSQLGQLNLASLRGRLIKYQLRLEWGRECHLCRVAGNTVWSHVACEFPQRCGNLANCYTLVTYLPKPRTSALNITLASAAARAAPAAGIDRCPLQQQTGCMAARRCSVQAVDRRDRQTADGRTPHRDIDACLLRTM